MTTEALSPPRVAARGALSRAFAGHAGPLDVVCLTLLVLWYLGVAWLNAPVLIAGYERRDTEWSPALLAGDANAMERPVLPLPHKASAALHMSILEYRHTPTHNTHSRRSR